MYKRGVPITLGLCFGLAGLLGQTDAASLLRHAEDLRSKGRAESFRESLSLYDSAITLYSAAGDKQGQAKALYGKGRAYDSLSDKRNAIEALSLAGPLFHGLGDRGGESLALSYLALDQDYLGDRTKAKDTIEAAIAAAREAQNPSAQAIALNFAGSIYSNLSDKPRALESYRLALALHREAGNKGGEASALSGMGVVYWSMGDAVHALENLNPALELYRTVGDLRNEAYTRTSLGAVYYSMDDVERALEFFEQAAPQWHAAGDGSGESSTLHNIAAVYERVGEYQKAIEYYNRALPIHRAMNYRAGEANTLTNLGRTYAALGEFARSRDVEKQALELDKATSNRPGEGAAMQNLCVAYEGLNDRKSARDACLEALAIRRAIKDKGGEASALAAMARVYLESGDYENAASYANAAAALDREVQSPRGEAVALKLLASLNDAMKRPEDAAGFYDRALTLFRSIGDKSGEASTLYGLARLEKGRGEVEKALMRAAAALELAESTRAKVPGPELRASYLATIQDYYSLNVDLLMGLNRAAEAFEVSERARARSLLDLLAESSIDIREGADPALVKREQSLRKALNLKADRLLAVSGPQAQTRSVAFSREIDMLSNEYRDVEAQIRSSNVRYADAVQPEPLRLREIQKALDPGTILLQYALGDERSYVWAISDHAVHGERLASRETIEKAARRFHKLAEADNVGVFEAARELSRLVIAPVAGELGSQRIAVAGDGALQFIPFAALPDPKVRDYRPLLEEHEFVSLPSASSLVAMRRQIAGRKPASKGVFVFADPVFSADDPRVQGVAQNGVAQNGVAQNATRSTDSGLPRLAATRDEAKAILSVAGGSGAEALGFDASLGNALGPALGQYRIVHFATHGVLDGAHPELSSLVLSRVDAQGRPQAGVLHLDEIYRMKLAAELVVLSACETALGQEIRGEGLVGLSRGFMYAGAPRVLASLWKVDDQATKELMREFYASLFSTSRFSTARPITPASALRTAQLKMWRQKRWQSPRFWAAFVLQGEWR